VQHISAIYGKKIERNGQIRPTRRYFLREKSQKTDFFRIFSESLKIFASEIKQKTKLNPKNKQL
jgi:hypothetical protein